MKNKPLETRPGINFYAKVVQEENHHIRRVELHIEGQEKPVYVLGAKQINPIGLFYLGGQVEGMDAMCQDFVLKGNFGKVTNPNYLSALESARRERLVSTVWHQREHRFLQASDFSGNNLHFILTTDRSDIPEEYRGE